MCRTIQDMQDMQDVQDAPFEVFLSMVGYFPVFVFSSMSEAVSRRKIAADIVVGTPVGMKFSKHDGTFLAGRPICDVSFSVDSKDGLAQRSGSVRLNGDDVVTVSCDTRTTVGFINGPTTTPVDDAVGVIVASLAAPNQSR